MNQVISKWNGLGLVTRIVIGLVIGALLGIFAPADLPVIPLLGTLFVGALKAVAPILVFFLVSATLANAKTSGSMKTIVIMYVCSTLVAALVAVVASFISPTILTLDISGVEKAAPSGIGEVLTTLVTNAFTNPVTALMNANYIGILTWAVALGIALRAAKEATRDVFTDISNCVAKIVRWVISLAPFGILGLVYSSIAENGIDIFYEYGHLILVLVAVMLICALVTNPIMAFIIMGKNPFPLVLRTLKDSGLYAFFTRSSAANIPVNMDLCEKLGLDKNSYSLSIPLGATINMAGAAITITVMSMAAAATMGISVDPVSAVLLCVLAAISACGASGVPGGSLLLIPLACSLFGISNDIAMQCVAIGLIIGVIQDSCETALNSSSDVLFTAVADYRAKIKAGIQVKPGKDAIYETTNAKSAETMEDSEQA